MAIKIFIAGDVVPKDRTLSLFDKKKTKEIFGDILPIIKESDIKIANLEAPVIYGNPTPIKKSGPNLFTRKTTVEVLKEAGFNVITLANNHFRDQGENGISDTINIIDKLQLKRVGGGRNINEARKILYQTFNNQIIAIINFCEHEFSIATHDQGGSNPLDLISVYNDICEAKKYANYILVISHGGVEHYQLPTPRMKKEFRFFVDVGADAVINHHQHCFSGYEVYNGKPIFYGLGNFSFDWNRKRNSTWNKGYAVTILFDKIIDFTIHPYIQCDEQPSIICKSESYYFNTISSLNQIIGNDEALNICFQKRALLNERDFIFRLSSFKNRYIQGLHRRKLIPQLYSKSKLYITKNLLTCESHREILVEILNKILNEK